MDERTYRNEPVPGSQEPVPGSQHDYQQTTQPQRALSPEEARQQQQQQAAQFQQQDQQQRMNWQAQQNAAADAQARRPGNTIMIGGQEVPYFPAPRGHASESLYRISARARQMEKDGAQVDLPDSAKPESVLNARVVPMPAGGIHALASLLWPDDVGNQDAFDAHIYDLLTLNRDIIRDDTSHPVNAMVRIPG